MGVFAGNHKPPHMSWHEYQSHDAAPDARHNDVPEGVSIVNAHVKISIIRKVYSQISYRFIGRPGIYLCTAERPRPAPQSGQSHSSGGRAQLDGLLFGPLNIVPSHCHFSAHRGSARRLAAHFAVLSWPGLKSARTRLPRRQPSKLDCRGCRDNMHALKMEASP
jgi:hypothetical protein